MSKIHVLSVSAVLSLTLLPACAAFNVLSNLGRTPADNPMRGAPLTYSEASKGMPFEGEKACSNWPLEDSAKVSVNGDQICVDATKIRLEQSHSDRSDDIHFASDSAGDGSSHPGTGHVDGKAHKIGSCGTSTGNPGGDIWVTTFKGCVPNQGIDGQPLVTAKSTYLDAFPAHSWKFAAAAPATPSAPPAAPAPAAASR